MLRRQGEVDDEPAVDAIVEPDAATVAFDDAPTCRQPDPGTRHPRIEALEHGEHPVTIGGADPSAIVRHGEPALEGTLVDIDPHLQWPRRGAVPDRVRQQVAEHAAELLDVGQDRAQRRDRDDGLTAVELVLQLEQDIANAARPPSASRI